MPLSSAVRAGIAHFNAGRYFEAHEAWEEHWGLGPPAERRLLLGLIKVAVALHHLTNGNVRGFEAQLKMGLPHLRETAEYWPELLLPAFIDAVESVEAQARFHGRSAEEIELPRLPTGDAR